MNVIIKNLYYNINNQPILKNISTTFFEGKITCIIGQNGSGKTTLIKCLIGIIQDYKGSIIFEGNNDLKNSYGNIGVKLDYPPFDLGLNGEKNLAIINSIKGSATKEIKVILESFQLHNSLNKKLKNYSLGMWNKLGIATAMLGNPSLIVLDEPSNGLDISSRTYLQNLLREERDKGKTILLSTHDIQDVYSLADYLICIKDGQIFASLTKKEIHERYKTMDELREHMHL